MPGDGDSLFHALGHLLKAAEKDIFAVGALREVACNTLEMNAEGYHTVWVGKYPMCKTCESKANTRANWRSWR